MLSLLLSAVTLLGACATPASCGDVTDGLNFYAATEFSEPWGFLGTTTFLEANGQMCWEGNVDFPDADIVFVLATAFNSIGESPTEHGSFYGEGYFPVEPCP